MAAIKAVADISPLLKFTARMVTTRDTMVAKDTKLIISYVMPTFKNQFFMFPFDENASVPLKGI